MEQKYIVIRGAREHNLKGINLEIPRDKFVIITGPSGSGKSSLALDTIYAEGQRRYVESLSAYARQFLEMMDKPDVDSIEGLSPAIAIQQKTTSKNPRSTVGTTTEIIGIDTSGGYFYIRNPDNPQGYCWIVGTFVTIVGDISFVPRFTPMPAPTTAPTGTAGPTFAIQSATLKSCSPNYWFDVSVLNDGNGVWTSGSVSVYDAGPPITTVAANIVNDFKNLTGCPASPSSIQGDLAGGESGHLQSAFFTNNPTGHEITLTVKLCTEADLAGTCTTNTYIFTP